MFIQTETTPNPATLKFIPGCQVMAEGTANFSAVEDAAHSPLALHLFDVDGVAGVFLGGDFISVTKDEDREWDVIKPLIMSAMMDHLSAGKAIVDEDFTDSAKASGKEGDEEIIAQIKEILETRVRPAVAQDGGDIIFHGYENGVVHLAMLGACSGCPSASMTLQHGIENMLRHFIPEITEVRAVE